MSFVSKVTAGAAIALALSLAPALADGYEKKKHYAAPAHHDECDAKKFGGMYIGVHGGMGTLQSNFTDLDEFFHRATVHHAEDGFVLGGQIGYNWARCSTVWGFEVDLSWANIDSDRRLYLNEERTAHSLDWLGSFRTRTGIALDNLFLYVTGGIAFANIETGWDSFGPTHGIVGFKSNDTRFGWVVGVGAEHAWTDRIRINASVSYYDFGKEDFSVLDDRRPNNTYRFDDHQSLWVSRIGINFALGHHEHHHEPMK